MRFLVLEEPMSPDGKQQFIQLLKTISLMRQLGANIRMREREREKEREREVTCRSSRTTVERSTLKSWSGRSGHVHNHLDSFSKGCWNLPHDLCVLLKHDPFIVDNLRKGEHNGKYECKRGHQTKLVPTSECYGLQVLETVNTSDEKCNYDDFPPEDVWPNFNAMVTKLQENYVGSPGEKFVAQHHGFDRDVCAG